MEIVNYSSLEQTFQQLQELISQEYNDEVLETQSIKAKEEWLRMGAIKASLENLCGVVINTVRFTENDSMHINLKIKDCIVELEIGEEKRLSSVQILSSQYSWINTDQILHDSSHFEAPNDLRAAVSYLLASLSSREAFQKDIAQLKKQCIVSVVNSFVVKISLQNGFSLLVEGSQYYPKTLNSVKVIEVSYPSCSIEDSKRDEDIKFQLNNGGFSSLLQMIEFLQNDRFSEKRSNSTL